MQSQLCHVSRSVKRRRKRNRSRRFERHWRGPRGVLQLDEHHVVGRRGHRRQRRQRRSTISIPTSRPSSANDAGHGSQKRQRDGPGLPRLCRRLLRHPLRSRPPRTGQQHCKNVHLKIFNVQKLRDRSFLFPHSHTSGQCSWTLTPANSMQVSNMESLDCRDRS